MGKRKHSQQRQTQRTKAPKGLPTPKQKRFKHHTDKDSVLANMNPFESARASSAKSPKFQVLNRPIAGRSSNPQRTSGPGGALERALKNRHHGLKQVLDQKKKVGSFVDRRIGESKKTMDMTEEERMLARLVKERTRRSKKHEKFALGDNDDDDDNYNGLSLTHRGKVIDESYTGKFDARDVILSDDEGDKYGGQLERADTEMHFGGGAFDRERQKTASSNPYGPSAGGLENETLGDRYRSRKEEMDELIMRKKWEKAEKVKQKENQAEKFEGMDDQFKELASLLQFRDKAKDRKERFQARKDGTQTEEEKEMDEWDMEMKAFKFDRKVKATDRTKTPEEIAKEEADKLHELETRRLARMSGDFEQDDLSDVSDDDDAGKSNKRKRGKKNKKDSTDKNEKMKNPDELDSDYEEDDSSQLETKFTADGLLQIDKMGNVVKKVGEQSDNSDDSEEDDSDDSDDSDSDASLGGSDDEASATDDDDGDDSDEFSDSDYSSSEIFAVGTKIKGKYRAEEQFEGGGKWYDGAIINVNTEKKTGNTTYDVEYDDGDIENGMKPKYVRPNKEKIEEDQKKADVQKETQRKRKKAKEKARTEMPYVFEVPTTLEALHDMIGKYAATGADACLIIQRIHAANSVRLDKRNKEKMQNFYDVLLRRFIGIGDALYKSGNGGTELRRYAQLDSLICTLYAMAQESPESAGAVWGRRIGIFQSALAKRIRDSEFIARDDEDVESAWPSTGTLLLLRGVGHVFPVTDLRHLVVTPTVLFLGQTLAQTPIRSIEDIVRGVFCSGLMLDYSKEAKRVPPEAMAFIASTLNLFASDPITASEHCPVPTVGVAAKLSSLLSLRECAIDFCSDNSSIEEKDLCLSLERKKINSDLTPAALLCSMLRLIEKAIYIYCCHELCSSETELFDQVARAMLRLASSTDSRKQKQKLPKLLTQVIRRVVDLLHTKIKIGEPRLPLSRRTGAKASELAVVTFDPRMEDPTKYSMSRDRGKTSEQAQRDKIRRETKREHKAISRELRLDAAFVENERRKAKDLKDGKARDKRNKNFAWLEQEQATINQQVAQGGGLLKGGGIGNARLKAKSGKIGIKKGGKF